VAGREGREVAVARQRSMLNEAYSRHKVMVNYTCPFMTLLLRFILIESDALAAHTLDGASSVRSLRFMAINA
jgi:hypothetical protein